MYCKEDSVIEWLDAKRKTLIHSTELLNEISELNYTNHSIDYFITNRIITNRAGLKNITSLQLFCTIDSIDKALNENNLAKFYTPNEINNYIKYRDKISISFPLEIHCIQINNEQYIVKPYVTQLVDKEYRNGRRLYSRLKKMYEVLEMPNMTCKLLRDFGIIDTILKECRKKNITPYDYTRNRRNLERINTQYGTKFTTGNISSYYQKYETIFNEG